MGAGHSDSVQRRGTYCLAAAIALLAAACTAHVRSPAAAPPAELALGRVVYEQNCAGCHGRKGEGVQGPELRGVAATLYPDPAQLVALVRAGTPRGMPPFAERLSAEQIEAVVAYTRSLPAASP